MVELDPSTKVRLRPLYRGLEIRRCYVMAQEFLFLPNRGTIRPACDAAKDQGVKYYASSVGSVADTVP